MDRIKTTLETEPYLKLKKLASENRQIISVQLDQILEFWIENHQKEIIQK